jgi:hypothetical protein
MVCYINLKLKKQRKPILSKETAKFKVLRAKHAYFTNIFLGMFIGSSEKARYLPDYKPPSNISSLAEKS